ncbi:MBL fold metallo-hydrolase [Acinetobacter puyangensis]|uniref:MBL fold metallo-hydrolase n=1 Tax=Acinetobacter puyangensis TaxID=1096779 RepID=UPI003A4E45E2
MQRMFVCSALILGLNVSAMGIQTTFAQTNTSTTVSSSPQQATQSLQFHQLSSNIYWVSGGVGNVGIIIGTQGVIVIDTTISTDTAQQLLAGIKKITDKPVTTVILTHEDADHVNGLPAFPANIEIIAQKNAAKNIANSPTFANAAQYLPNHLIDQRETIVRQGITLKLLHWGPAHTAGDLIVYLPEQHTVFTGDIFTLNQHRTLIHYNKQGSSEGWVTNAQNILALDADTFVVGHGEVQNKAGIAQRVKLVSDERNQIKTLVAQKKTLAEIQKIVGDPPPTPAGSPPPRFAPFSEVVYRELTEKK